MLVSIECVTATLPGTKQAKRQQQLLFPTCHHILCCCV